VVQNFDAISMSPGVRMGVLIALLIAANAGHIPATQAVLDSQRPAVCFVDCV